MLYILCALIPISFLLWEKIVHDRRVRSIPIRIHVNGTRGKSTVTRLIARALREKGIRCLAKVTGETPCLILPDGREEVIRRRAPSRIQEQMGFMKKAAAIEAQAVVVECMALDPWLQWTSEAGMIRSTLGVITNVRRDHLEVMGQNADEIAEALSQTIPEGGILITGDQTYYPYFEGKAKEKGTRALWADGLGDGPEYGETGMPFERENVAVARKACLQFGMDDSLGFGAEGSDPERSPSIFKGKIDDRTLYFIDAFRANDIDSTRMIQQALLDPNHYPRPHVAILNNRADRPLRMVSFASYLGAEKGFDYVFLTGDHQRLARRYLNRAGRKEKIQTLKGHGGEELIREIGQNIQSSTFTILGMGNFKGSGEEISRFFRQFHQ